MAPPEVFFGKIGLVRSIDIGINFHKNRIINEDFYIVTRGGGHDGEPPFAKIQFLLLFYSGACIKMLYINFQ